MKRLTISNQTLSSGSSVLAVPEWHDLASWTHAWDAVDATTYVPDATEQSDYSIDATPRVESIPDRIGGFPALRDQGPHASLITPSPAIPGPKYIASSSRFNGRPAFVTGQPGDDFYAVLSPTVGPRTPSTYFNVPDGYAAPWTVVCLIRPTIADGANPDAGTWDSTTGGVGEHASCTIHAGKQLGQTLEWEVANWTNNAPTNRITSTHVASENETTLVIVYTSTTASQSFLDLTWRDSSGGLQKERKTGTLDANAFNECFWGWVHPFYMTCGGIKAGTFTETEIDKIRSWAARFIPASASLGEEP